MWSDNRVKSAAVARRFANRRRGRGKGGRSAWGCRGFRCRMPQEQAAQHRSQLTTDLAQKASCEGCRIMVRYRQKRACASGLLRGKRGTSGQKGCHTSFTQSGFPINRLAESTETYRGSACALALLASQSIGSPRALKRLREYGFEHVLRFPINRLAESTETHIGVWRRQTERPSQSIGSPRALKR